MGIGKRYIIVLSGLIILCTFFTDSCDPAFSPVQENSPYDFSMNGYLDASADTQWVRVMPVRDTLFFFPRPIDAIVTLKDMESGTTVAMHDSLFQYYHDRYTHNFWTTMDLQPAKTYRLIAKRSDDPEDEGGIADINLPEDYPTPLFNESIHVLYIDSVERLADVSMIYYVQVTQTCIERVVLPHLKDSSRTPSGQYRVRVTRDRDYLFKYYPGMRVLKEQIFVAAAGPNWPNFGMIDESIVNLPHGVSNVKNGVGYVAGIVSKTIPYKTCYNDNDNVIGCPLEK